MKSECEIAKITSYFLTKNEFNISNFAYIFSYDHKQIITL